MSCNQGWFLLSDSVICYVYCNANRSYCSTYIRQPRRRIIAPSRKVSQLQVGQNPGFYLLKPFIDLLIILLRNETATIDNRQWVSGE
jgi:hypothetical protein